jgi:hypothetical protein
MSKRAVRLVPGIVLLCLVAGAAAAEEIELFPEGTFDADPRAAADRDDDDAEAQALQSAAACDQYGPDYELVPGTTTCIKATGHVQVDVYVGPGRRR